MSRRKKIIYAASLIVILLLILLVWLLTHKTTPAPTPVAEPQVNEEPHVASRDEAMVPPAIEEATSVADATLESLSTSFTERYGSFSTESDYANLKDVMPLMTEAFAASTSAAIASATPEADYYGVTTRVLNVTVESRDDAAGTARVRVSTQRQEAKGGVQNLSVKYQEIVLDFVTEEGGWKIDAADWQT